VSEPTSQILSAPSSDMRSNFRVCSTLGSIPRPFSFAKLTISPAGHCPGLERLDGTEWSLRNDIIGAKFLRVREQLMAQNALLGEWLLEKKSHESL
jgi:hypothetical protein